jgi:proteic killer suppression protein
VIKTFANKPTAAIFEGRQARWLPQEIQDIARRKLKQIDSTASIVNLRIPPGNRLELLKGARAGQWSFRINDQWRIDEIRAGNRSVTADTALRLARLFGTDAQFWISLQGQYDLETVEREMRERIEHEVRRSRCGSPPDSWLFRIRLWRGLALPAFPF